MEISQKINEAELNQQRRIKKYYHFQSKIYDLTRWAFLFGRLNILNKIPYQKNDHFKLVEIGCGTGFNLYNISKKFPNAKLVGLDISKDMINIADKKLSHIPNKANLICSPYEKEISIFNKKPDIILFSYFLTMINPQWKELIEQAYEDMSEGGKILVVDFHNSNLSSFKKHMSNHHVRMDGHILKKLEKTFKKDYSEVKSAYGGVWEYFIYIGGK